MVPTAYPSTLISIHSGGQGRASAARLQFVPKFALAVKFPMSVGSGRAHEALFGPPSALIRISEFLASANNLEENHNSCHVFSTTASSIAEEAKEAWLEISSSERDRIQEECRFVPLQSNVVSGW